MLSSGFCRFWFYRRTEYSLKTRAIFLPFLCNNRWKKRNSKVHMYAYHVCIRGICARRCNIYVQEYSIIEAFLNLKMIFPFWCSKLLIIWNRKKGKKTEKLRKGKLLEETNHNPIFNIYILFTAMIRSFPRDSLIAVINHSAVSIKLNLGLWLTFEFHDKVSIFPIIIHLRTIESSSRWHYQKLITFRMIIITMTIILIRTEMVENRIKWLKN